MSSRQSRPRSHGAGVIGMPPPSRILIVDDNRDVAQALVTALRIFGHDVRVAFDGPSALAVVGSFTPDVALLDIGLPVMDGYELVRRLRTQLPRETRFIALSGYGQPSDRTRSREAGFDMHLVKPIEIAALQHNIAQVTASGG